LVVGVWEGGRIGTFRGLRKGKSDYGATVFGNKAIASASEYAGYGPLIDEIFKFFKTGKPPVPAEETIEMFAFMSGADESKAKGGVAVSIAELIEKAKQAPIAPHQGAEGPPGDNELRPKTSKE
jgi:hypothetical protein